MRIGLIILLSALGISLALEQSKCKSVFCVATNSTSSCVSVSRRNNSVSVSACADGYTCSNINQFVNTTGSWQSASCRQNVLGNNTASQPPNITRSNLSAGQQCLNNSECASSQCSQGICQGFDQGADCQFDEECGSGYFCGTGVANSTNVTEPNVTGPNVTIPNVTGGNVSIINGTNSSALNSTNVSIIDGVAVYALNVVNVSILNSTNASVINSSNIYISNGTNASIINSTNITLWNVTNITIINSSSIFLIGGSGLSFINSTGEPTNFTAPNVTAPNVTSPNVTSQNISIINATNSSAFNSTQVIILNGSNSSVSNSTNISIIYSSIIIVLNSTDINITNGTNVTVIDSTNITLWNVSNIYVYNSSGLYLINQSGVDYINSSAQAPSLSTPDTIANNTNITIEVNNTNITISGNITNITVDSTEGNVSASGNVTAGSRLRRRLQVTEPPPNQPPPNEPLPAQNDSGANVTVSNATNVTGQNLTIPDTTNITGPDVIIPNATNVTGPNITSPNVTTPIGGKVCRPLKSENDSCQSDYECGPGLGCNYGICVKYFSLPLGSNASSPELCVTNFVANGTCSGIEIWAKNQRLVYPFSCNITQVCHYRYANTSVIWKTDRCQCDGVHNDTGYCDLHGSVIGFWDIVNPRLQYSTSNCSGAISRSKDLRVLEQCGSISSDAIAYYEEMQRQADAWTLFQSGAINGCSKQLGLFDPSLSLQSFNSSVMIFASLLLLILN